uniref:Uncharacterized protein n=1 Tax=Panagrolaimus superbus TaxID=310955 RepID=A0A914YGU2_9BILA
MRSTQPAGQTPGFVGTVFMHQSGPDADCLGAVHPLGLGQPAVAACPLFHSDACIGTGRSGGLLAEPGHHRLPPDQWFADCLCGRCGPGADCTADALEFVSAGCPDPSAGPYPQDRPLPGTDPDHGV